MFNIINLILKKFFHKNKILIHENKIYDVNNSIFICTICKIPPREYLYLTKNDNWFLYERGKISPINKNAAKHYIKILNKIDLYEKYFGKLEEA